jgi:hypothetical protein
MKVCPETYITRTQQAVGVFCIVMLGMSLVILLYAEIPEQNQGSVGLVIGALIANSGQVINWLFGATKDGKDKDRAMAQMADTVAAKSGEPPRG